MTMFFCIVESETKVIHTYNDILSPSGQQLITSNHSLPKNPRKCCSHIVSDDDHNSVGVEVTNQSNSNLLHFSIYMNHTDPQPMPGTRLQSLPKKPTMTASPGTGIRATHLPG